MKTHSLNVRKPISSLCTPNAGEGIFEIRVLSILFLRDLCVSAVKIMFAVLLFRTGVIPVCSFPEIASYIGALGELGVNHFVVEAVSGIN